MIKKIRQFLYIKRNEVLLNKLKEERWNIKTTKETIEKIIQGYSISRYGDGEFDIAFRKKELYFQYYGFQSNRRTFNDSTSRKRFRTSRITSWSY